MVIPRSQAMWATALCISPLEVKIMAKWFRVSKTMIAEIMPIKRDWITQMKTEYLAARGCPDPSSLDTRTLKRKSTFN